VPDPTQTSPRAVALHLGVFLLGTLALLMWVGTAAGILSSTRGGTASIVVLGAALVAALTAAQAGGHIALALAMWRLLPRSPDPLTVAPSGLRFWVAAALGGATIWALPSWVASAVVQRFPEAGGRLADIGALLLDGTTAGRALLFTAIVVCAPLAEEIVFRGYLWRLLSEALPEWAVWLTTSGLFMLFHFDPLQSVAIAPAALLLGWLRWTSGSLGPSIVAHGINNAAAVGFLLGTHRDGPALAPAIAAMTLVVVTVGITAGLSRRDPR